MLNDLLSLITPKALAVQNRRVEYFDHPLGPGKSGSVEDRWRTYIIDDRISRCYSIVNMVASGTAGMGAYLPMVDRSMPTSSYIRLVAFADDVFSDHIALNGFKKCKDLKTRIDVLVSHGLPNGTSLHAIREARNKLAHDPSASCEGEDVDSAINEVHTALEALGLVGTRPPYEFFLHSTMRNVPVEGWSHTRDYFYGLKVNKEEKIVEVSWSLCTR